MATGPAIDPAGAGIPIFPLRAELAFHDDADPVPQGRSAERLPVDLKVSLRERGVPASATVELLDLSTNGFRAGVAQGVRPGEDVWLRFPDIEPLPARVVWAHEYEIGCAFTRPLHPAVLELIAQRSKRG